jgi:hypothetical protein
MSEETRFWGVSVERYGQGGYPTNTLLESTGSTPESKPFRVYPVFSTRERADRFVWEQWQRLSQELIEQTAANVRQIRPVLCRTSPFGHSPKFAPPLCTCVDACLAEFGSRAEI